MTTTPQIPTPAHMLEDSMLSRHFGKETVNYFSSKNFLNPHIFRAVELKHLQALQSTVYRSYALTTRSCLRL